MSGILAYHDITYKILGNILKLSLRGTVWTTKTLAKEVYNLIDAATKRKLSEAGKQSEAEIKRLLYYAKRKGYVDQDYRTTQTGKQKLASLSLQPLSMPKSWNQKWSMIIFDVPEENRKHRYHVRRLIKQLGFVQLQQSVWIHPAVCEKEFKLISDIYSAGGSLLLLSVNHRDSLDEHLEHFKTK